MNALRDQRIRLAISVGNQVTSPETAPTHLLRVLDVVVEDSLLVEDLKSATRYEEPYHAQETYLTFNSAQRSVTLHVTAQRLVDMVVAVDSEVNKVVDMAAAVEDSVVDVKEDKLATLAVVMDTCLVSSHNPSPNPD